MAADTDELGQFRLFTPANAVSFARIRDTERLRLQPSLPLIDPAADVLRTPAMNQSVSNPPPLPQTGDATGGVIPYKNPHALTAYYLGIFSIIPGLGLILGIVAVVLGVSGLKKRKQAPVIRGAAHAWIGIVAGGGSVLVHLAIITFAIWAATHTG